MVGWALIAGRLAGLIAVTAFFPYILSTIRGKTKPNRASWFIWTVIGIAVASTYHAVGASETLWVAMAFVAGPLIVTALSMRYGEGGWNRFDGFCLAGAGAGMALWLLFDAALEGLLLSLFVDLMAYLPTIKKAYLRPEGESTAAWSMFFIADGLNLVAAESWDFGIIIYPAYMFVLCGIMMILLLRKRYQGLRFAWPRH